MFYTVPVKSVAFTIHTHTSSELGSPAAVTPPQVRRQEHGRQHTKSKATYSVIFLASSVQAAEELAEKTR